MERVRKVEVSVEFCHARGEGVPCQSGQRGGSAKFAHDRLRAIRNLIVSVVNVVNADLTLKRADSTLSGCVATHFAGAVMG